MRPCSLKWMGLVIGAWTLGGISACDTPLAHAGRAASPARKHADAATDCRSCGDGEVSADEECDPMAPGWQDVCDQHCRRTAYESCTRPEECDGLNSNCAAYTHMPEHQFCADLCESDETCRVLPGFRSTCNFAWCVVLCEGGSCPNGMTCIREQNLIDAMGQDKGRADVCVIAATPPRGDRE